MKDMKTLLWFVALALTANFTVTACSDDDDNSNNNPEAGDSIEVTSFDDLHFFQNAIAPVNTLGQLVGRSYGEPLDNNDTTHLYIGVETLAEAEEMFRTWMAPDIELSTIVPTTNGLTCPLTDIEGKPQGTIYFKPGTESGHVAEVTASEGTALKHFSRITFLLNSAWPYNSDQQYFYLGDIVPFAATTDVGIIDDTKETFDFVCIKEGGNGVKPQFISISKKTSSGFSTDNNNPWIPSDCTAKPIAKIISKDWDYWVEVFKEADCGELKDEHLWYDHWYGVPGITFQYGINLKTAKTDYFYYGRDKKVLYNQNRLTDIEIINKHAKTLTGMSGSPTVEGEGWDNLFDRNNDTKWTTYDKINRVWFVEFSSSFPGTAKSYKLTTGNDTKTYPERNPVSWKLYGKRFLGDEWQLMHDVRSGDLPKDNKKTKEYTITNKGTYQYYRFEVTFITLNLLVQLDGFDFVYE